MTVITASVIFYYLGYVTKQQRKYGKYKLRILMLQIKKYC